MDKTASIKSLLTHIKNRLSCKHGRDCFCVFLSFCVLFSLVSCSSVLSDPSSKSTSLLKEILQTSTKEGMSSASFSSTMTTGVKEIGSTQDLFFVFQNCLYAFQDEAYIQIESIELFHEYWQTLTDAGALHSVFMKGPIQLEYDHNSPCTIRMIFSYDSAGEIIAKKIAGSPMEFTSEKTAALYRNAISILDSIILPDMSLVEKEMVIHDYVIANTVYSTEGDMAYLSTADSVLMSGEGQCQGYTEAISLLLALEGIESRVASGFATSLDGTQALHAWNLVLIDGNWYHLDATWNDPIPDTKEYALHTYMNRSDEFMRTDHTWSEYFPSCPIDYPVQEDF